MSAIENYTMDEEATTAETPEDAAREIYECVSDALKNRRGYERRMQVCSEVRRDGIKRRKDAPWQTDEPLKIADPAIDQIKPQLVQGIYTADTMATFTCKKAGIPDEYPKLAAQYHSDHIKRCTNFFRQFVIAVDMELQDGKSLIKTIWNAKKKAVEFHAMSSIYLVVAPGTETLEDAEWVCQIHRLTKRSFKRMAKQKEWEVDADDVKSLCGNGVDGQSLPQWVKDKERRTGIHVGSTDEEIILWEYYSRNDEDELEVTFMSPTNPEMDLGGAQPFAYQHGMIPYVELNAELIDKDYHSPRGVVEKVLPEERIATKFRNMIGDYAEFAGKPMFTTKGAPIGNLNNLTARPGALFSQEVESIQTAPPPDLLGQEMAMARQMGEKMSGTGDYALQASQPKGGKDTRTATEIGVVAQMSSFVGDLRSRINRDALTLIYKQSWLLLVQYSAAQLEYFFNQQMGTLPEDALADAYLIEPSGNPDGYSKAYAGQIAQQVVSFCKGDPAFDQDEVKKYGLEAVDPSLVKRLFIGTGAAKTKEAEDQARDVLLLREGFPVQINPGEDNAVRAIITASYLEKAVISHEQIMPDGMQALQQHIEARVQALKHENAQAAAALVVQLKQIKARTIAQLQAQQQQAKPQPGALPAALPAPNPAAPAMAAPVGAPQ